MESVNNVITNIISELAGTIIEHALYPFQVENKIRDFESATRDLMAIKEDVKTSIEIAKRQNGSRTNTVAEWLNKVEAIEKEAEEIKEHNRKRTRSLWSNYTTSRSVVKKLRQIRILCDQKATIEVLVHPPDPLAQEIPASSSISPDLESTLQHIKNDAYSIIGIWGMGGVGKTHLLKQINNELSRYCEFNVVIFVTCSKECSEEQVQNEIIARLRLDNYGSMEQKQSMIYNFLKERSFVLLLDDLWSRVDLEIIGIPDPKSTIVKCKRKVILTTRSTEVCGQMEVTKRIRVDVLNWEDAWSLFKDKVTEEIIDSDPLIQKCAVDVVKELGGLPLALITIGRSMQDKIDPSEWEQAVVFLKQARLNDVEFSQANQSVFHTLKFSYDSLRNDTLRQCFLHCSLWPEDHHIQKNKLVEFWMGLGLINERHIQAAYNIGYSYIRRLQAVCLLEIISDDTFKMHDVIRDMALWIANNGVNTNKWIVRTVTYKERQHIEITNDAEKLSVMNNDARNVSFSITCLSSKVTTILLNHNYLNCLKPLQLELFSELNVLDLSDNRLKAFPTEICKLVHLQFLSLSWNPLKSLPEELADLTNLKYLLLRGTNCTFPTKVIFKLKALRVLDLSGCDNVMDHSMKILPILDELQTLPDFQALGITISSILDFHTFSQTVSVPVRWLDVCNYKQRCICFSSCFLANSHLQSNLSFLRIKITRIVEYVEFESTCKNQCSCHLGRLEHLKFQAMDNMKEVVWKSLDPKIVFPRLQVLEFSDCPQLASITWVVHLPCIRELSVIYCRSIKQLIRIDELKNYGVNMSHHSFLFLKKMLLFFCNELESISDPMITFPVLEFLEVDGCEKLKKLPFEITGPPKKLKWIRGNEEWWNNIELEDSSRRSSLEPFFKKW